jgi:ribosomal protein S18 acetylase RimI-like enzyme
MTIKPCTKEDIQDMIQVLIQSYLEHYTHLWEDEGVNYMKNSFNAAQLEEEMSNPNSVFYLIHDGQKYVGLVKLNIDSAVDAFPASTTLELERIYFIKEAAGKGFGKAAVDFVSNYAIQKHKRVVWLKAMQTSPAVEFYKKRGFEVIRETELDYIHVRSEFKKMVVMAMHV